MSSLTVRGRIAMRMAELATWASRKAGRGRGGMIGGLVAMTIDPGIMRQLGAGRRTAVVTGTNGKSTTTRMLTAALSTTGPVASNGDGDNMDAGIISALIADRDAPVASLEIDELHVPAASAKLRPEAIVLLNLSRDQLDRVGEITTIERRLREGVRAQPQATIIANCDDVLITSVAYDSPKVVWVAAGGDWAADSVGCPRTGDPIIRRSGDWYCETPLPDGRSLRRPTPDWWFDDVHVHGPDGFVAPMTLSVPGRVNRGNATQAIAAAVALGVPAADAVRAVEGVAAVAGRYSTVRIGDHEAHLLLAKNPAGWREALSMLDRDADGVVISVNGQVPDGEDLSWLWDVAFEHFEGTKVFAAGERGTDLSVRLTYADVEHELVHDTLEAIRRCPTGRVEVLANYTAFRDLNRDIARRDGKANR